MPVVAILRGRGRREGAARRRTWELPRPPDMALEGREAVLFSRDNPRAGQTVSIADKQTNKQTNLILKKMTKIFKLRKDDIFLKTDHVQGLL